MNAQLLQVENVITGSCPVTVVKADRTCFAILDACEHYSEDHFKNIIENQSLTEKVKYMYTTAFFIDCNEKVGK